MNSSKIEIRHKHINDNGDITIDSFTFERSKWCIMIKLLKEKFNNVMDSIFATDIWKRFVDHRNSINVKRVHKGPGVRDEDIFHYDFWLNINGRIIQEKDLTFKKEIPDQTLETMTGLVMISLHGFGMGPTRISELLRLQQHQLEFKSGCLYYLSVSHKRKSSQLDHRVVTHKLPPSISRCLPLYD